jgi:4-cresol dehydrogenase (hydroxylating)
MGGRTPLDLIAVKGHAPWLAVCTIPSASVEIGRAVRAVVAQQLEGVAGHVHVGAEPPHAHRRPDWNVRSTAWRKRSPPPDDLHPDRDRCGVMWMCVALPFDGTVAGTVTAELEQRVLAHGLEPNLALTCASARSLHLFLSLLYDRDVPGEDARAQACHDDVMAWLAEHGHVPYRLGIQSMDAVPPMDPGDAALIATLKRALDPNDVLAPGRYDFRRQWPAPDAGA